MHVSTVHPGVIRSDFRQRAQWRGEGNQRQKMMDNLLETKLEGSDGSVGAMIHLEGIFPTTVAKSGVNQI